MPSEIMIDSERQGLDDQGLDVGVVGTGAVAQRLHLPTYAEDDRVNLAAVCDVEAEKARAVAEEFGIDSVYTDHEVLFEEGQVDAVSVCLPNHLHRDVVVTGLERDVDVLCEKPISPTLAEADEMIAAADESDGVFMVNQSERFSPVYEKAKELIDRGIVGDLTTIRSRFSHPGPEGWSPRSTWFTDADAAGGGAMIDIGIHNADLVTHLFGEVSELMGYSETISMDAEVEDAGLAVLKFERGCLGTFETAWRTNPTSVEMQVVGEDGVVYADKTEHSLRVEFADDSGTLDVPVPDESKYGGSITHFVDSVLSGTEPTVTGRDARRALELVIGVYRSSDAGSAVELPIESGAAE